jgi:putative pyoverdin transport system ATP-binding/permease protein
MRLLLVLLEVSKIRLAIAIFASIVSGISTVAALICVLHSLRGTSVLWWQFMCFAALAVVSRTYARLTLNRMMGASILRLRRRMIRSILHVPLEALERIGAARLLVSFSTDLTSIGAALRNFVHLFSGAAFLLACLVYLAWLSPERALVTGFLVLLAIAVAILLRQMERQHGRAARAAWDQIVQVFRMLLDGVKQMKLNRMLGRQVLRTFEMRVRAMQNAGNQRGWYSEAVSIWIQSMAFLILGLAVFGPFGDTTQLMAEGYGILALLYIRGPLQSLIFDSGAFTEASVALQRIDNLGLTLSAEIDRPDRQLRREMRGRNMLSFSPNWKSLTLNDVVFRYDGGHPADDFALGPMDFALHPREIVFISGGNGSGKTTLLKVLTGLYTPTKGTIRFDDVTINEKNVRLYRNKFAVVFSDFCLFEGVADLNHEELTVEAELIAKRFRFKPWMLSPRDTPDGSVKLSAGERRRMALLMALLDERPILVFDEWAADQDPQYKDLFYNEILPSMRAKGKLVIVLSHDERYFHVADRVLWLERGQRPVWRTPDSFAEVKQTATSHATQIPEPAK